MKKAIISGKEFTVLKDVKVRLSRRIYFKTVIAKFWFHTKETQEYNYV